MARKKKTTENVDMDVDFGDLEDLNDDLDFSDDGFDDPEREASVSSVAKDLASEAGEGFVESVLKKTAEKALPPEYSANYTEAIDLANFASEVVDRNKQKIDRSLFRLGKEVKKLLPMQIGMLDRYLERKEEEFAEYKQQTEEEMRNNAVASELGTIFDKQLEVQKALEARRSSQEQVDAKERLVTTQMTVEALRSIDANLALQTAFTTQIGKEFFRKSLELQFKSYYVQADMLRTMRDYYKGFSVQFTNIEKNTGLPDFVKLRTSESVKEVMRNQVAQTVYTKLFDRNKYLEGVKRRVGRAVDEKVSSFTDSMSEITDALSMMNDGGPGSGLRALAGIGASMGGSSIGEYVADKISPKLKERIKDNKAIQTGANYLGAFADSPSTVLKAFRDKVTAKQLEAEQNNSWTAKLYGLAKSGLDLTGEDKIKSEITKESYLTHNQPAIFDNKVHRSITEVIPLYLAQILKQNTDLTSMYLQRNAKHVKVPGTETLMYDYRGRKLETASALRQEVEESVFNQKSAKKRSESAASGMLSDARTNITSNKEMDKDQKKALQKTLSSKKSQELLSSYLANASKIEGISFDFDTLVNNKDQHAGLKQLVEKDPELAKVLETLKSHASRDNRSVNRRLTDVQNVYPIAAIKQLFWDASKLTRSKEPNVLQDKHAMLISKALSRFIFTRGEDVSVSNILSRLAFSFFLPEEYPTEVRDSLTLLIEDVRRINSSGDDLSQSSLVGLLSLVNSSLKENFEINPEVFKTLQELYPEFVRQKHLTAENIIEGKLQAGPSEGFVSFSDIRDSTKTNRKEVEELRSKVTTTSGVQNLLDQYRHKGDEFLKGLNENKGSLVGTVSFLFKSAKEFTSTVSDALSKTSKELQKSFDGFSKQAQELIEKGNEKAGVFMVEELGRIESKLDHYIKLTQEDISQRTKELEELKNSLSEVTTDNRVQKSAQKELEVFIRMGEHNLKALNQIRKSVSDARSNLSASIQRNGGLTPTDLLTQVRTSIGSVLTKAKEELSKLEAAGQAMRGTGS